MEKTYKVNADETVEITVVKEEVEQSDLGHLYTLLNQLKFNKQQTLNEQQNVLDKMAATAVSYDAKIAEMEATIADVEQQVATLNKFATYIEYKTDKDAKAEEVRLAEEAAKATLETPVE